MSGPRSAPSKPRGAELALLLASLALWVGVLEVTLRLTLPIAALDESGAPPSESDHLRYAGSIFSRHVLAEGPLEVTRGDYHYRVNALGYRGGDFPERKPDGELRVIVYGGSAAFDIFADDEDAWPARLEAELRDVRAEHPVRVINAGVPGHASLDSVGRLFAEGHRFTPDVVVLYHAWNDIKYFGSPVSPLRAFGPYVASRDPVRAPRGRLDRALARHSHLYRHLRLRFLLWNQDVGLEGEAARPDQPGRLDPIQLAQYELALRQFVDLAHNIGAEPVITTQMRLPVAESSEADRERIHYDFVGLDHATLVRAFDATDEIAARVAREEGATLVDASGPLSGRSALFADHVHLSADGSAALARLVAAGVAPLLKDRAPRAPI